MSVMQVDDQALCDEAAMDIMGWTRKDIEWAYTARATCWHDTDGTPLMPRQAWRPLEDDTMCLQVVEAMLANGFECHIELKAAQTTVAFSRVEAASAQDDRAPRITHASRRHAILAGAVAAIASTDESKTR